MARAPGTLHNTSTAAGINVRPLEDWLTFEEVAQLFGITRGGVAHAVWHSQVFDFDRDVRVVSRIFVVRRSAVMREKARREAERAQTVAAERA